MFTCINKSCDLQEFICHEFLSDTFNPEAILFNISLHIIISCLATLGNVLVIITIWRTPSLHSPSNTLLFGLALSDLFIGCVVQTLHIELKRQLLFSEPVASCSLVTTTFFISMTLVAVTFLTMTSISIDRFLAVYLHLRYREVVTKRRVQFLLVAIWTTGGATPFISLLSPNIFNWTVLVTQTVSLSVVVFVWLRIYQVLKRHQAQIQDQVHVQGQQLNVMTYRKSAINSMLLVLIFLLCYLPVLISLAIFIANSKSSSFMATTLSYMLVYLNSSLNPLVYCWRHREIRIAAKQMLAKLCRFGNHP
ncbi:melanocyte-stimulating hormone receptor-like [Oculina patagonica]